LLVDNWKSKLHEVLGSENTVLRFGLNIFVLKSYTFSNNT